MTIAEIIAAVDEPIRATRCENGSPGCIEGFAGEGADPLPDARPVGGAWPADPLFLQGVTLADVVAGRVPGRAVPLDDGREAGGRVAMVYLDANATEPLRPEARAAMLAALDVTGNPSSVHAAGRAARRILEDAREIAGRPVRRAGTATWCSRRAAPRPMRWRSTHWAPAAG